jgi:NAD(P)-dependent dehydrogenase (short-subunit alcohol dehydrogenase family)
LRPEGGDTVTKHRGQGAPAAFSAEPLSGRIALVTGAGQGLGRAIAHRLALAGAEVVVTDVVESQAAAVANEIRALGRTAVSYLLDVTRSDEVERVFDVVEQDRGPLEVLVNNAGLSRIGDHTHNVTDENWHDSIAVMQHGVFYGMRSAGRRMLPRAHGIVINISSIRAFAAKLGTIEYSAPKAALVAMTQVAGAEWGPFGVRVNAIAPGPLATEMTARDAARGVMDEARHLKAIPAHRWGDPAEVGDLVVFLASDHACYINGTLLTIDGALTAMGPDGEFSAPWPLSGPELRQSATQP